MTSVALRWFFFSLSLRDVCLETFFSDWFNLWWALVVFLFSWTSKKGDVTGCSLSFIIPRNHIHKLHCPRGKSTYIDLKFRRASNGWHRHRLRRLRRLLLFFRTPCLFHWFKFITCCRIYFFLQKKTNKNKNRAIWFNRSKYCCNIAINLTVVVVD